MCASTQKASTPSRNARSSVPPARPCATISASRRLALVPNRRHASSIRPSPPFRGGTPMYRYDEFDAKFVAERVEQFRGQVQRRLAGELNEDQFKLLRLMNGLYLQLHAYMLRIAVPYGTLAAKQLRMLAHIARKYE